ncbi:unnamed protein product [Arctogadus glacialis]
MAPKPQLHIHSRHRRGPALGSGAGGPPRGAATAQVDTTLEVCSRVPYEKLVTAERNILSQALAVGAEQTPHLWVLLNAGRGCDWEVEVEVEVVVEVEAGQGELISPKEPGINTYGEAIPCDGVIALVLMRKGGEEC